MFSRFVAAVLNARLPIVALMLLLAGLGVRAWQALPIDAFPDVSSTQVKVILKSPGMTPQEIETRVVAPIEIELLSIPDKRVVRSVSKYAIADITVDFVDGTDVYWARQQVTERLNGVIKDLPAGTDGGLAPITTPLGELFMFTIDNDALTLEQKRTLLDWTIRPALRVLPGVADVNTLGGHARAFEIVPDDAALHARGLGVGDLRAAIGRNNRNDGAGRLIEGGETLLVRTEGAVRDAADLGAVVVRGGRDGPVRIANVAQVRLGSLTRYGAVTRDGHGEAVQGIVLGLRGADAGALVERVAARLADLEKTLPEGTRLSVFYDRGQLVGRAVGTVTQALLEAVVLVIVLLVLMLGDWRAAIVVAATLPLSALATFVAMRGFGLSANLMSLGGLAIAIGMLVDAAVVVVENVVTRLAADGSHAGASGRSTIVARAVAEVGLPVGAGVAIIAIVFLPLLTLEGLEGKMFVPVALTIVFALVASLIVAFTAIPVLASLLLKPGLHRDPWLVRQMQRAYRPLLDAALARPAVFVGAALLALAAAAGAYLAIGKSFMPTMDEGDLIVQLEKLPSIGLEESIALDGRIQRAIRQTVPEVHGVVARTGTDEIGLDPMGFNETDLFMVLAPREQWRSGGKEAVAGAVRAVLGQFPGIAYSFTQPIEMRVAEMLSGVRGDLAIKLSGPDLDELTRLARRTVTLLASVRGAEDVISPRNEGVQYYTVVIDRLRAGNLGLSVEDVQDALRLQIEGVRSGIVIEEGRRTPVLVRGSNDLRASPEAFGRLLLALPEGRSVPLADVASLKRVDGPVKIDHENAARIVVVRANVRHRDLVGFVDEARARFDKEIPLPPGYRAVWSGQFENQQRAAARLALVVPAALAAILLLLYLTLGSARQTMLVFANIPFALVGGVFALWAAGEYLSVPASVGFIALLGIAVLNGLVLISHFNELRAYGMPIERVVVEGARRRLRPVLMTAAITALGLVPLVVATGPGSEVQRPLAVVVIGGLVSSTFLTLVMLPILYRRFGEARPAVAAGARS